MGVCDAVAIRQIWSTAILKYLRGRRLDNNPLTLWELNNTQTFARATKAEKEALHFAVTMTPRHSALPSSHDSDMVRQRDDYLIRFADGESLDVLKSQRRNWLQEIRNLQFAMERETEGRTDITSARPFAWIFGRQ